MEYEQTEDREAYTDFVNETYLQVPEEFREKWEDTARILRGRTLRSTVREVADYLGTVADYTKARGEHRMERISLNIFLEKAARDTAFILLQQVCCS